MKKTLKKLTLTDTRASTILSDDDDLEDGIRLGCQSLPLTDTVKVSYS